MLSENHDQGALERDYAGDAASLRAVRADVAGWLGRRGSAEDERRCGVLIVSEMASNAVQAKPGSSYHLQVCAVNDEVVDISVQNRCGRGSMPVRSRWGASDERALSGRGLSIVAALSQEVAVQFTDEEVTVRARIRAGTS